MLGIKPLSAVMGAEVRGVDLARPIDAATFDEICALFSEHLLLVFPEQHISAEDQIAFSRRFGELQVHVLDEYRHPRHPEIYLLSNVDRTSGKTLGVHPDRGTLAWHSDLSFQARPALATILYGIEVPRIGADTLYADMRAALEALPSERRAQLSHLRAIHDLDHSRQRMGAPPMTEAQARAAPPVEHPVVRTLSDSQRHCLYVSYHVRGFVDMPDGVGRELLDELMAHATSERFVYRHRWRPRDVVMWDNRSTMHCATEYDATGERRIIHRTVVLGDVPA